MKRPYPTCLPPPRAKGAPAAPLLIRRRPVPRLLRPPLGLRRCRAPVGLGKGRRWEEDLLAKRFHGVGAVALTARGEGGDEMESPRGVTARRDPLGKKVLQG